MSAPGLIQVEELFADPEFSGASISPDGTRIGYLAPWSGRTNVWVCGIDEEHADAVCVTRDGRRGIRRYFWTDDPRWLLYLQDTDGNEDWHLYRVDLGAPGEPAVDLTPMPRGSRVMDVEPFKAVPGSVLVSMNRRPLDVDVFRIDVATGEIVLHRENPDRRGGFVFGPGGEVVAHSQADDGTFEYHAVDDASGRRRLFHRQGGPEHPLGVHPARITPDGAGLLVGSYQDSDDLRLVRVDIATGEQSVVADLPGHSLCIAEAVLPAAPPTLFTSRRTGAVLAARFVGDRPVIHVVDPGFAEVYAALSRLSDGVLAGLSSDDSERLWVATFAHDREPGLTYLYDHGTGESRLLFRPYPRLDPDALAPMTPVAFAARDGLPLHGFLTLPVGVEPAGLPLVLFLHGGPWFHDVWGYNPTAQFLANRGYAVLQVNFRGSSGYGRRHTTAAIREFAGTMHDDVIDAADWAVKQGYADPARIGIHGGSYGGYAALVGVTVTPDYFAAAVDYCGISSLPNFMRTLPEFLRPQMVNNFLLYCGDPADPEQEADLLARSPITMVDRIRTPLLVVQGANDVRVVKAESDAIVEALRARGVAVEYLVADDEGHGFQNPENVMTMFRTVERHFAAHLGGLSEEQR
ncbi:S9 family peptidase [Jiangella alkaliphila]|uniref:Dipeptidyl aminopeptidase/acylaminoacyl peptidase n=1 Tax=Jiangella alkaliphila TaxID=419479 RepID=A0A1H2ISA4_9ACTN|nr:S9 family peptidase [Jiangella alkaliphila]SDU47019.1 Dipeptidyl aminopeptidase/acylaminoacyl peptidase [Jiangella alkaliphila]